MYHEVHGEGFPWVVGFIDTIIGFLEKLGHITRNTLPRARALDMTLRTRYQGNKAWCIGETRRLSDLVHPTNL